MSAASAKETYKHASKRIGGQQNVKGKHAIVSLVEREGKVRSFHVANATGANLRAILVINAHRGR